MHLSKTSAIIVAGLLLVIFIGIVVASVLSQGEDSGSFFAAGKAIQVKYNDNLFVADTYNETVSGYNERLQIVAFNGKLEEKSFSLGQLFDVDLKEGQKYKLIVNYVGGSYESSQGNEPKIVFELQKNSKNYDGRESGTHYVSGTLPLNSSKSFEKVITITSDTANSTNFDYVIMQATANGTTFKNYRIQVFITEDHSKVVSADGTYGELPTIDKDGYEFLGWYDNLSGDNKITADSQIAKKYSHTLYAHWKKLTDVPVDPVDPEDPEDPVDPPTSECEDGYVLQGSSCVPKCDVDNCTKCDAPDNCTKCSSGYSVNNGKCVMNCNKANCETCSSPNVCSKCKSDYGLRNGECTKINKTCSIANCLTCKNDRCTKCEDKYKLTTNGTCEKTCPSGYNLVDGQCEADCRVANCAYCASPTVCQTCQAGYKASNNGKICAVKCNVNNCTTCSRENYCSKCRSGYQLNDGKCYPECKVADTNCTGCTTPNVCSRCRSGYDLKDGKCVAKSTGKCYCCGGSQGCTYSWSSTGNAPSSNCAVANKNQTDCKGTTSAACNLTGCVNCSNGKCIKCNVDYTLNNGKCVKKTCPNGQTLKNGNCVAISCNDNNCLSCSSASYCLTCKSGYTADNGKCIANASVQKRCWCYYISNGQVFGGASLTSDQCARYCRAEGANSSWGNKPVLYVGSCKCYTNTYSGSCTKSIVSVIKSQGDDRCKQLGADKAKYNSKDYRGYWFTCTKVFSGVKNSKCTWGSGTLTRDTVNRYCGLNSSCAAVCGGSSNVAQVISQCS